MASDGLIYRQHSGVAQEKAQGAEMRGTRITYTTSAGSTPETERAMLAQIYRFILTRRKAKAAGTSGSEDDGIDKEVPADGSIRRLSP